MAIQGKRIVGAIPKDLKRLHGANYPETQDSGGTHVAPVEQLDKQQIHAADLAEEIMSAEVQKLERTWEWMTLQRLEESPESRQRQQDWLKEMNCSQEQIDYAFARCDQAVLWGNDTYQVAVFDQGNVQKDPEQEWPDMIHLSIKRRDIETMHDWRDMWAIKNALVGPENEAVELYPAESRVVDGANQYHLWVFKDPGVRLPFGMWGRGVSNKGPEGGKQRPFPDPSYIVRSLGENEFSFQEGKSK